MSPSVQFSHSVVSDSLRPYKPQHARPPCSSPTPGVYSDSCPSSQWCHPAISSSVIPSPLAPNPSQHQSLFPVSQLFTWGGQSFSFSIIPSKEIPGLISFKFLTSKEKSQGVRVFILIFFNWKIIAVQYSTGFCHTSTWICHRYTYVSSSLNLPLISL